MPISVATANDVELIVSSLESRPLKGFEKQRRDLQELLRVTLDHGESNSALVLGPRGSGKTLLVETVLEEANLGKKQPRDDVLLVRLNGLLETNDRMALKNITKQLKLENVVGDRVFGSFSEHLEFLLKSLRTGEKHVSKPIVFVLEEFDLFCAHHNQTLLYNLFDTAQSKAAPLLVIGLSARIDVVEMMEKRVQSRFGRRIINVLRVSDFTEYYDFVGYFLANDGTSKAWKKQVEYFLSESETKTFFEREVFFQDPSFPFLKQLLYCSLLKILDEVEEGLDISLDVELFKETKKDLSPDLDEHVLKNLTQLDLALAIACMHQVQIQNEQPVNFEMVLGEFKQFTGSKCSLLSKSRDVLMKSWENLINMEVIRPTDRGSKVQNEYRSYGLNVLPETIKKVVKNNDKLPSVIKEWAKKRHF